ncbi:MAG: asparagine synthase (glutamine-hydrolyzing) [Alphaproteobacteria bacterium]|jgi:asparagine synthase (glutamine-hydrolysing)
MCGIAGIMTSSTAVPSDTVLDVLGQALAHRGPDGQGRYKARGIGLVHTRLAIIDLETGDQPITETSSADAKSTLIANGEIYNYPELTAALDGVGFSTRSDCEPPLHLYRRHGLDFTDHLRGMYAIAIHDPEAGRLVLARDPFGIKPLYYVEKETYFAFASEPQALLAAGLAERSLNESARDELMQLQFTMGRDTCLEQIKRVLPGETLVVSEGRIVARRRLNALPEGGARRTDEKAALETLDSALEDTVLNHQRSDVPYGMFLSGGIDSSILLALMARLNERPVRAYTAGFPGSAIRDERAHARRVAEALGADHVEVEVTRDDFWRDLPRIVAAVDDPCADYAIVPTYALARVAARDVKVVLCGEGGDEIFAGYGRYRSALRPTWLGGRTMRARGKFDGLGVLREAPEAWRDGVVAAQAMAETEGRSRLQVAQAVDCADWLPNDLLIKLDRCLMAHGLEGRTPFLDLPFADFAFCLPDGLKTKRRHGKWLLRKWLAETLPIAAPFERKRGFSVPVAEWIAEQGTRIGPLVAAQAGVDELCRPGTVETLFTTRGKRPGFAAWTLLFYALWHAIHIVGQAPDGDVEAILSA